MSRRPDLPAPLSPRDAVPTAEQWNAIKAALEANSRVRAGGSLAGHGKSGSGIALRRQRTASVLARLSGSSSPYSWAESYADGTAVPDGETGSDAYAVNGETGLGGDVVWLHPTAWDHRFVVEKLSGCGGTLKVRLTREEDDTVISGVVVTITRFFGGSSSAVVYSGALDLDGTKTVSLPLGDRYSVVFDVPSRFYGATATLAVDSGTRTRPCFELRDFAYCETQLAMDVTDCGGGGGVNGLLRGSLLPQPNSLDDGTFTAVLTGTGPIPDPAARGGVCSTIPRLTKGYYYEASLYTYDPTLPGGVFPGGWVPPTGGDPGISGSTYQTTYFRLRERPFACSADAWGWQVAKVPYKQQCDQSGRLKTICGSTTAACGATATATVASFGLGSDWAVLTPNALDGDYGPGPGELQNCGFGGCLDYFPYNLDCSPSGLINRTLTATFLAPDCLTCGAGASVGGTITLTCQGFQTFSNGYESGTGLVWSGSDGTTSLTLVLGGWNAWEMTSLDVHGHACSSGGSPAGQICHPTMIELMGCYGTSPYGGYGTGAIFSVSE